VRRLERPIPWIVATVAACFLIRVMADGAELSVAEPWTHGVPLVPAVSAASVKGPEGISAHRHAGRSRDDREFQPWADYLQTSGNDSLSPPKSQPEKRPTKSVFPAAILLLIYAGALGGTAAVAVSPLRSPRVRRSRRPRPRLMRR